MYNQEHKIAQAEHAAMVAKFSQPAPEGMTVQAPNIIDRMVAAVRTALADLVGTRQPKQSRRATYGHGAAAK